MKQAISLLLISGICGFILPWWIMPIIAFATGFIFETKALKSLLISFITIFLLWGVYAMILNTQNDSILATKVSVLILKKESPEMMILISALIGGLLAGFAGYSGSLFKNPPKKSVYY